jgi:23S rRNA G2069 N7-methylase RlmK/C1962 C5-methylase RlmI
MKYTPEVQRIFKGFKPPYPGFIVDIAEYPDYLALRVYKDNVESFSEPQKVALAEYLYQVRDAIRSEVNCHIEGVTNAPPSRRN